MPVHSAVEQPQVHHVHQPAGEQQGPQMGPQQMHHYAPSGVIQVVGSGPQQYSAEQYGKPESASVPANYKPFGSWGLYIGGNPADGYYSNYYKSLGSAVDKQQVSSAEQAPVKPASAVGAAPASGGPVGQAAAFGPVVRQASSYPYGSYAEQVYPFDYYTPADLNSGSRVAVMEPSGPSVYAAGPVPSPVQVGSQVYGTPVAASGSEQPVLSYADSYSTKRVGSFASSKSPERAPSQQQQQQQQQVEAKGYRYAYANMQAPNPMPQQQQQQYAGQSQVVAYPVPVGSQIVGSQPGTEGAYMPYGVHGYTRYAVKPTVVASSEQYYHQGVHSAPMANFPVYKQQPQQQQQPQQAAYQPMGFYGYPMNQLHYSQGSIVPAFGQQGSSSGSSSVVSGVQQPGGVVGSPQAGPVSGVQGVMGVHEPHGPQVGGGPMMSPGGPQVEAAGSEKSETQAVSEHKPKEQKRA